MNILSVLSAIAGVFLITATDASLAAFEESNVPIAVNVLYCDTNPRIVVQFADAAKNVWYPAGVADRSKAFLATALMAKSTGQSLYYYGTGDALQLTAYCTNVAAREVQIFGLR